MKKEIATKWVYALRSGKYKQGQEALCKLDDSKHLKHCCLGVLCEVVGAKRKIFKGDPDRYYILDEKEEGKYEPDQGTLSEPIMKLTGIKSNCGEFSIKDKYGYKEETSLVDLNDAGKSFKEISDIIEQNWKQL